jgi:F-type H+-transporting ATPase subunit delta
MAESADIIARDARTAARLDADVGREQIAIIYARALLGAAQKTGQSAAVLEEMDALVREVLTPLPRLEAVLGSLLVSHEEKSGILDRVFGGRMSPLLLNFLKVVSRRGRLDCLRAIHKQARKLYEGMQGGIRVRLTTPTPLDPDQIGHITENLRARLGGEPILESTVDPELIGGAVLRVGDTVYDASIARQLQAMRQQMIDRSIHEIQSRRDRFRSPAGN